MSFPDHTLKYKGIMELYQPVILYFWPVGNTPFKHVIETHKIFYTK